MIDAFSAQDVRAAEQPLLAVEPQFAGGLMHRAAAALCLAAVKELRGQRGRVVGGVVVGLVGPGNNGGDALHALALLARRGVRVVAVLTSDQTHADGLAALRAVGGSVVSVTDGAAGDRVWLGDALAEAFAADVVLDGLLGLGARGGLRGEAAELVRLLDELCRSADEDALAHLADGGYDGQHAPRGRGRHTRTRPAVIAVDLPSGIGVDDGSLPGPVLAADVTVTFGAPKPGLLLPPAAGVVGQLRTVDLDLLPELAALGRRPVVRRVTPGEVAGLWPVPRPSAHKYSRGVVGVLAGSVAYPGAAVLTVAGAQGAGCGMVRYVGPEAVAAAVTSAHPEVVAGRSVEVHVQAWVLGPGVADDDEQHARMVEVLTTAGPHGTPVIVDAGGLVAMPERVGPHVVLTPHAGELATLLVARGLDVDRAAVEAEPLRWATEARRLTGATVLLKGATTIVVGSTVHSQADAPAWLATAGAGDVLAGVLGALLAGRADDLPQDEELLGRLAAVAALVHGRAARRANAGPVTAGDVARALPGVVAELLG